MKRILLIWAGLAVGMALRLSAQPYSYSVEGFEASCWATAASSTNTISSSTGSWTVAKKNVRSATTAFEGSYSLVLETKTNALTTPFLSDGAGTLTWYAARTSGTRWLAVTASTDGKVWSKALDSISLETSWTRYQVAVNDPTVRYLRFQLQSNGGVYLDNILITRGGSLTLKPSATVADSIGQTSVRLAATISKGAADTILSAGFCLAEHENPVAGSDLTLKCDPSDMNMTADSLMPGTEYHVRAWAATSKGVSYGSESVFQTRPADAAELYFYQPYNDASVFPTGSSTEESVSVKGQGTWLYKGCKRSTSTTYITDGSVSDLRIPKEGCYLVTPVLEQGVSHFSFVEGRGRKLNLYVSVDRGATWSLYKQVETSKGIYVDEWINRSDVNRIRLSNEGSSGGDADVDNISVYVYPQGKKPSVTTIGASDISRNTALVSGQVTSPGDNPVIETGICWSSSQSIPYRYDNREATLSQDTDIVLSLKSLPSESLIRYRAYAVSRSGVGYGAVKSFTTLPAVVCTFSKSSVNDVTAVSAMLTASLQDNGGDRPSQVGYCIMKGNVQGVIGCKSARCVLTDNVFTADSFAVDVTGLKPQTTYTVCAVAVNKAGIAGGKDIVFTTGSVSAPQLSIGEPTAVTSYNFCISGTLLSDGNAPCEVGFCCDTTALPTIGSPICKVVGYSLRAGDYEAVVEGLQPASRYYVRMYAANDADTVYSAAVQVNTSSAATYWLSPSGSDATGNGTRENPYYSLSKVVDKVRPGDCIFMEGGVYRYSSRINILVSGADGGGEILLSSYNGRAVLDFSAMSDDDQNQGIRHSGSYWHYVGIDIANAGDNGLLIERNKPTGGSYSDIVKNTDQAHHNLIENCRFYGNRDSGLQLKNLASYNLIINCDSYFNRDSSDGDADGFAPKITVGNGNYFYGCRAWNNSDDGWDSFLKCAESGFPDDVYTVVENCWAFRSGFLPDGTAGKGNGNGFKMGGNYERHNMILIGCLAFDNLQKSYDQNHNAGDMTLINCTAFDHPYNSNKNRYQYRIDEQDVLSEGKELTLINSIAVWDGQEAKKTATSPISLMGVRNEYNCDWKTRHSDYMSVDTTGVTAPRGEDGRLPDIPFMHLKEGSRLVDGGISDLDEALPASVRATLADIRRQLPSFTLYSRLGTDRLTYSGKAPDCGCFEFEGTSGLQEMTQDGIRISISGKNLEVVLPSGAGEALLALYNMKGECLRNIPLHTSSTVIGLDLPHGVYSVQVRSQSASISTKLIVR